MQRYAALCVLLLAVPSSRLCAQRIPAIDSVLHREIRQEHVAGAVIQVKHGNEILHRGAYGFAQRYSFGMEELAPPDTMTEDHLFDLASLTKVFGTTFAVMILVDRGLVDLDAPVRTHLSEFAGASKDAVTPRLLLTHTGGLAPWEPLYYHAATRRAAYEYIARMPLEFDAGAQRHYSDLGFMLLGYLVERITQEDLDAFLLENVYGPLALRHTTYNPLQHGYDASEIAATSHGNPFERRMVYDDDFGYECDEDPTSWDGWRQRTLRGEVNDGNAYHAHGGVAGHAGLFSTVDDIQVLIDVLLNDGRHRGRQLVRAEVVRTFLTPDATGNGLGWAMDPDVIQAEGAPAGTFGHTGFTGTNVVVIPEHDLSIILLTNRQNAGPDDSGYYFDLNPIRQRIVDIVLETGRP